VTQSTYTLRRRGRQVVNTDAQRRCYDGAHYNSEVVFTPWEVLDSSVPADKREERLKFWRELNDYAVSQRGAGARYEFEYVPNC
jgi:hypothetical protein